MIEICVLLMLISGADLVVQSTNRSPNAHGDVESHLLQLEQTVKDLKSASNVQERKYASVLSNVLSKLTATTDELKDVENELDSLKKNCQSQMDEFKRRLKTQEHESVRLRYDLNISDITLQAAVGDVKHALKSSNENISHVNTDVESMKVDIVTTENQLKRYIMDIGYLKANVSAFDRKLTPVQSKLSHLTRDLNSTNRNVIQLTTNMHVIDGTVQSMSNTLHTLQSTVVFEGWDSEKDLFVQSGTVWKCPNHRGIYYDTKTGYFTIPVTGSYVFWVNGFVECLDNHQHVTVYIKQEQGILGFAYGKSVEGGVTFTKVVSRFGGFML